MKSRMDRYYEAEAEEDNKSRTEKNQELYNNIIEKDLENSSEIELKINELNINIGSGEYKTREEYHQNKSLKELSGFTKEENTDEEQDDDEGSEEEKVYDLNSYIERAKQKQNGEEKKEKLTNTKHNILNDLYHTDNLEQTIIKEREKIQEKKKELRELIDTIVIPKEEIKPKEEEKEILNDLMSDGSTIVQETVHTITTTISLEKKEEEVEVPDLDKSFYDGTVVLNKKDVEPLEVKSDEKDKSSVLVKILLFLLGVIFTAIVIFIVKNYISF